MSIGKVTGFTHAGITVKNLDKSLEFYCELLGLELVSRHSVEDEYILKVVNVPGLKRVKIAFLSIPGSDAEVELLEYEGVERFSGSCRPCDFGSGHICLYVSNIDGMYSRFSQQGTTFKSDGPVIATSGRNKGRKIIYMMDPDGYIIELIEKAN